MSGSSSTKPRQQQKQHLPIALLLLLVAVVLRNPARGEISGLLVVLKPCIMSVDSFHPWYVPISKWGDGGNAFLWISDISFFHYIVILMTPSTDALREVCLYRLSPLKSDSVRVINLNTYAQEGRKPFELFALCSIWCWKLHRTQPTLLTPAPKVACFSHANRVEWIYI